MRSLAAITLIVGCASRAPVQAPTPARPSVQVAAASCLRARDVEDRITQVFAEHGAERSGLACNVVESGDGNVTLQVTRATGEVGLDRSYTFGASDCASAGQLLALTVDRWLTSFPEWAAPPRPPAPPTRWTEVSITAALSSMWLPLGADGQAGVLVDRGATVDRFGGSLLVRAGIPQSAGNGRFQLTMVLAGASWRHRFGPWTLRAEARGGGLLVSGIGYAENASDWLPWWEGAVFGGRDFAWGSVGLEVAATALRHRAVTRDGLVSEDIPLLRVGVGGLFEIL